MFNVTAKFTPKQGGSEFEVRNVRSVDWSVDRTPGPNGHVGMRGFLIGTLRFTRLKSLQEDGIAEREDETIALAAGTDKKAYFSGEITVAPPDDEANVVQTIRWDTGYISSLRCSVSGNCLTEDIEVTVTDLKVNDSEFTRLQRAAK